MKSSITIADHSEAPAPVVAMHASTSGDKLTDFVTKFEHSTFVSEKDKAEARLRIKDEGSFHVVSFNTYLPSPL